MGCDISVSQLADTHRKLHTEDFYRLTEDKSKSRKDDNILRKRNIKKKKSHPDSHGRRINCKVCRMRPYKPVISDDK